MIAIALRLRGEERAKIAALMASGFVVDDPVPIAVNADPVDDAGDERTRIWNERYYLPVLALAAFLLPNFRGRARRRIKR